MSDKKSKDKQKEIEHKAEDDDDFGSDNSDLENAYFSKTTLKPTNTVAQTHEVENAIPVHESLTRSMKQRRHLPEDETADMRDQRTIFVGNLPLEVLSKKVCIFLSMLNFFGLMNINIFEPLKKQLQRHILSFVPSAKIESIRFRSIPFQVPTTKLPNSDDEGNSKTTQREARPHAKQRSSNWRAKDEGVKVDEKKFLTPAQKKKIAYINQEFHTSADFVNAYIVFAHSNESNRPANLPPLPPTMNPYQAALQAVAEANGSLFMDRVLRVDKVGKAKAVVGKAGEDESKSVQETGPRFAIFVGNLDFASKEEDLRTFFEGLISVERGSPGQSINSRASNPTRKPLTWVTRVRIVRDNATQLGRGFAYVEFVVCNINLLLNSGTFIMTLGSGMCG